MNRILNQSEKIIQNIISFITNTNDYLNLRSTNTYFYNLMFTIKIFYANYLKKGNKV